MLWLILALAGVSVIIAVSIKNRLDSQPVEQFFLGSANKPGSLKLAPAKKLHLQNLITTEVTKLPGNWAVAIKDLGSNETFLYRENEKFVSASLYKLAVLWATLDALEKNQISEDDTISVFKLDGALRAMITVSDNDTAAVLAEKLGWGNIDKLMETQGIADIDLISPKGPFITARSTMAILERIYTDTAVSPQASGRMKDLLFDQKINDRIPKFLPGNVKVGHKTGEIDNFRHDAGIVLGKKSDYIFVFLSETPSPAEGTENIANLSKKIFEELETN